MAKASSRSPSATRFVQRRARADGRSRCPSATERWRSGCATARMSESSPSSRSPTMHRWSRSSHRRTTACSAPRSDASRSPPTRAMTSAWRAPRSSTSSARAKARRSRSDPALSEPRGSTQRPRLCRRRYVSIRWRSNLATSFISAPLRRDANNVSGPGVGTSETRAIRIARAGEYDSLAIEAAAPSDAEKGMISERMLIMLAEALQQKRPRLFARHPAARIARDCRRPEEAPAHRRRPRLHQTRRKSRCRGNERRRESAAREIAHRTAAARGLRDEPIDGPDRLPGR